MADETHEVDLQVVGLRITVPKKNVSQFNFQLLPANVSNVGLIVQSPKGGALALYNPETDVLRKYVPANQQTPDIKPGDPGAGGNTSKK